MSKWEYHVVSFEAGDERFNAVTMQTILNQLGAETWKIIAITPLLGPATPTAAVNSEQASSGTAVTRTLMVTLRRRLLKPPAGKRA